MISRVLRLSYVAHLVKNIALVIVVNDAGSQPTPGPQCPLCCVTSLYVNVNYKYYIKCIKKNEEPHVVVVAESD